MHHFKGEAELLIKRYADLVPPYLLDILPFFTWLPALYHPNYMGEIKGMAEVMGISKDVAIRVNFVYELESYCTSAIVKLMDGTIVHSRNLDFHFPDEMRNVTY